MIRRLLKFLFPRLKDVHVHTWGKYEEWGYIYQRKRYTECGLYKIIEQ